MPHPEREHELMIEVARLTRLIGEVRLDYAREKARADAAEAELAKHEGCIAETQKAFDESLGQCLDRAEKAEEALAAARWECEGLRRHLRRMIDWADLHVHEVEGIAGATQDPKDIRRARAARAEYDFACKALAAPAAAAGKEKP